MPLPPSKPDPRRSDRLADVYARAERLRQRRARRTAGTALGSVVMLVTGVLVGANLDSRQLLQTVAPAGTPATSSTSAPQATTTTTSIDTDEPNDGDRTTDTTKPTPLDATDDERATGRDGPPGERGGDDRRPTTTVAPAPSTTTTTAAKCRNSRDPACGPLRYEPVPVNKPLVVEVTFKPSNPEPGEEVTFTVKVSDDGPVQAGSCVNAQQFGEEDETAGFCTAACAPEVARYGTWDPPPPDTVSFEETFRHTYDEAGTYTATFAYNEGGDCSFSPHRSDGQGSVTLTVE